MKFGLYPRLALAGIRKNKRLYIPYLLTCTGMAMMYYIIIFLQHNEMLDGMRGGTTASTILALGGWVVAIFACIFLFYTQINKQPAKRAQQEIEKQNPAFITSWAWGAATWGASRYGKRFLWPSAPRRQGCCAALLFPSWRSWA